MRFGFSAHSFKTSGLAALGLAVGYTHFAQRREYPQTSAKNSKVFTFSANIGSFYTSMTNPPMTVKINLFADTAETATKHVESLNSIVAQNSISQLTNAFCEPSYDFNTKSYSLESCTKMLAAYKHAVSSAKERSKPFEYSSIRMDNDHDLTYFGRRFNSESLLFTGWETKAAGELSSFYTDLETLDPKKFNTYLTKQMQQNYGSNSNLQEVEAKYTAACEDFLAKHQHTDDPVELALGYRKLQEQLKTIFDGKIVWVPKLYSNEAAKQAKELFEQTFLALYLEAKSAFKSNSTSASGITPLMYIATRPCAAGELVTDCEKYNLAYAQAYLKNHDVNAKDSWGRTALFYVALEELMFNGHTLPGRGKMTELLLAAGADPAIRDKRGLTALDYFRLACEGPDQGSKCHHKGIDLLMQLAQGKSVKLKAKI